MVIIAHHMHSPSVHCQAARQPSAVAFLLLLLHGDENKSTWDLDLMMREQYGQQFKHWSRAERTWSKLPGVAWAKFIDVVVSRGLKITPTRLTPFMTAVSSQRFGIGTDLHVSTGIGQVLRGSQHGGVREQLRLPRRDGLGRHGRRDSVPSDGMQRRVQRGTSASAAAAAADKL